MGEIAPAERTFDGCNFNCPSLPRGVRGKRTALPQSKTYWIQQPFEFRKALDCGSAETVSKLILGPPKESTRFTKMRHNSNACEKFSPEAFFETSETVSIKLPSTCSLSPLTKPASTHCSMVRTNNCWNTSWPQRARALESTLWLGISSSSP